MSTDATLTLHATTVAWGDRGLLITGPSGSGKSTLALELMAYGCILVSDDQTCLTRESSQVIARAAPNIQGQIEARGIGILTAQFTAKTCICAVIDLGSVEETRLPLRRSITYIGIELPLFSRSTYAGFAPAVLQFLKAGRSA